MQHRVLRLSCGQQPPLLPLLVLPLGQQMVLQE
jgi:hypothetical protein